jgi:flagellar hook-length control protein FliK
VLAADTKGDAATMPTAKGTVDPTAGVLPAAATAAPDRAAAPTVSQVATPVGAPDWAHELSDRVNVLVNQNLTHAQIKLSPADLGPIEVRISLSDGQANVSFTTHSHVTSEALQAAAPKLRESLGSQGYTSVNVDVSQQQFRERTPQ